MTVDTVVARDHTGQDADEAVGRTGADVMLGFWGTVAVLVALFVLGIWFVDRRRRAGGSGLSDREQASFDRRRNDPYGQGDNLGGGGGGPG